MRGDVNGGRIERLAEIAERKLGEQRLVVVLVERAPAAGGTLHADQPVDAEPDRFLDAFRLPARIGAERRQRDQRHRRVVDVGIVVVGIFEGPAARLDVRQLDRPVAAHAYLPIEQPLHRHRDRLGILAGEFGVVEGEQREHRVPDRTVGRLDPGRIALVHAPAGIVERREPLGDDGMRHARIRRHEAPSTHRSRVAGCRPRRRPNPGAARSIRSSGAARRGAGLSA